MIETAAPENSIGRKKHLLQFPKKLLVVALAPLFFAASFFFVDTVQAQQTPPADPAPPTTPSTPTPTTRTMTGSESECRRHSNCVCSSQQLGGFGRDASARMVCTWTETDGTEVRRDVNVLTDVGVTSRTNPDGTYEDTPENPPAKSCSAWDVAACIRALPGMLMVAIAFFFLTLAGIILFVAGTVFNFVVLRTVFQFGTYFGTSDGMLVAWGVMRDIANIGLLFGFIFMGVLLILNVDSGGHGHGGGISAKKAIPKLIIFAVLLNFSLFASQVVIDVSNAFASSFATLAGEECDTTTTTEANPTAGTGLQSCAKEGISGKILGAAGLTAIWDEGARDNNDAGMNFLDRPYSYAVSLIMLAIFVLVTALVLLAGSIMLIIRVVVLSLLMVTSPIGFAGMAIPKLQGIASMWWSKLMSQAFFAPVYLLLIFISIKLTENLMDGEATLANAMMGNGGDSVSGNMQVVMVFLVVIGFMIGSLMAATKMGAMGAKFATSAAAGMTVGAVGFAGRRTVGRASTRIANNIRSSPLGETAIGRRLAGVADYGSKASFSLRNVSSGALGKMGVDIGKANKTASHGYHGIEDKAVKERVDYAKSLKGPRGETDEEMNRRIADEEYRLQYEEATATNAAMDADAAIAPATQAQADAVATQTAAVAAQTLQRTFRDNIALALSDQQILAAQNPGDTASQVELVRLQQQLAREDRELAQADQAVTQSSQAVTQANEALAQATAAQTAAISAQTAATNAAANQNRNRGTVDERTRQRNFARDLNPHRFNADGTIREEPPNRPRGALDIFSGRHNATLGGHADHQAANDIISYAGQDDTQRQVNALRDALRANQNSGHPPAPAHPPAAPGGGTPHP